STLLGAGTIAFGYEPFVTVSASGYMFDSYDDPVVNLKDSQIYKMFVKALGGSLLGTAVPEEPKFAGILPRFNHSYEPDYRVQTGSRNIEDIAKIVSFGG
ncbi:hypothetical protein PMAYCL1PPCAC_25354, partial [Pristionchus mayeri]